MNGFCKSFRNIPPRSNAIPHSLRLQSVYPRNLQECLFPPRPRVVTCFSSIRAVSVPIGPAAVLRSVRKERIYAIQRIPFWGFTHIGKEVLEHAPPLTDSHAKPSVVLVSDIIPVCASIEHAPPSPVCLCPRFSVRSRHCSTSKKVVFMASAGCSMARPNIPCDRHKDGSTRAAKEYLPRVNKLHDDQVSVDFSDVHVHTVTKEIRYVK